jgi:hypothetical protein
MLQSKIDAYYEKHSCYRVCQGDIVKDFAFFQIRQDEHEKAVEELRFPYLVVLTQDCDLEQYHKKVTIADKERISFNQFLPSILVTPAFPAEILRDGNHFVELFDVKQDRINSQRWKIITQNKDERYHYLHGFQPLQVPDLLIDFKVYFTITPDDLYCSYKSWYLATVNELFREHLSQRFCNYLNRIGLPEIGEPSDN